MAKEIKVTPSSGNVFADLGFDNPEEELAKARLAGSIAQVIKRKHFTEAKAAEIMGIDQSKLSDILNGRLENFSSYGLMSLLSDLMIN